MVVGVRKKVVIEIVVVVVVVTATDMDMRAATTSRDEAVRKPLGGVRVSVSRSCRRRGKVELSISHGERERERGK